MLSQKPASPQMHLSSGVSTHMRLALVVSLLLAGCTKGMYYPKPVTYYDEECEVTAHQMVLAQSQLELLPGPSSCQDESCLVLVVEQALGEPSTSCAQCRGGARAPRRAQARWCHRGSLARDCERARGSGRRRRCARSRTRCACSDRDRDYADARQCPQR